VITGETEPNLQKIKDTRVPHVMRIKLILVGPRRATLGGQMLDKGAGFVFGILASIIA
jgi:hypothetical protein